MTPDGLVGRLVLHPGATPSVICERPMVSAALLGHLTEGRRAALLPELIAAVFTLCADAQRSTARRAVKAALGLVDSAAETARDALAIAMHVVREHLQRLALDLPALVPSGATSARTGVGAAPALTAWLRDAPVMALHPAGSAHGDDALCGIAAALPGWLERRLFGMPPQDWLAAWRAERGAWLARWCDGRDHTVTQWLAAARDDAQAIAWPCRALDALRDGDAGMRTLGAALAADEKFAERPLWRGEPAETGTWTRSGREESALTLWDRLGARFADLACLAAGVRLASGALTLADGEGIAWTEMSRGLLVHWVRLEPGERDPATARAARYHVLAPTEWNFHPDGAFARLLTRGVLDTAQVRLAAATLDPCLACTIEAETHDA